MILIIFERLNPLVLVLVICPLLAVFFGTAAVWLRKKWFWGAIPAFLLPLLFIASDFETLQANWAAWILYGLMYVLLASTAYKLTAANNASR